MAKTVPWTVTQKARNVFLARVHWERRKDWEQWWLLTSDRHWDNPASNHKLQKEHLDEAVKRKAGVLDIGDMFCLMQGKYDPRHRKSDVRPEHDCDDYIDAVVESAVEFFAPYAANLAVIGVGNHEEHIRKRLETNVTERFCSGLHQATGCKVHNGQYGGWLRFLFCSSARSSHGLNLKYHHGSGGGGPVTKGVIQHNRRASFVDADMIASGHIHEKWALTVMREYLTEGCTHSKREQLHICTGTYKDDYADGANSWEANRGQPPKPQGGWWLRFYSREENNNNKVHVQAIAAD